MKIVIFLGFFLGFLMIALAIWFKPLPKQDTLAIDVTDRETGICAGMYKEGFKWGYGQFSVQVATMRLTKHSEEEIKESLLRMTQNKLENL